MYHCTVLEVRSLGLVSVLKGRSLLGCCFWRSCSFAFSGFQRPLHPLALGPYPSSEPADLHIPTSPSLTLTLLAPSFKDPHEDSEKENMVAGGGRDSYGVWGGHVHTAVFKMDNQRGPTARHRELCSVLCGSLDGRGAWGEWMHVYVWLRPFAVHLKPSQYC